MSIGGVGIDDFGFWKGRDAPAVVVPDSQLMMNPN